MAGILYAISAVPATGMASSPTLGSAAAGIVLLVLFAILERRAPTPLVPLQIFTTRRAVVPNASILLLSMVGVAWLYVSLSTSRTSSAMADSGQACCSCP